jgi:adenylate cyclase
MSNFNNDTFNTMKQLCDQSIQQIDLIIDYLAAYLASEKQKQFLANTADIRKIHDVSLLFKEKINIFLKKKITEKIDEKDTLYKELSETRHDLRNYVNIIFGYTEIVIERFQEVNATSLINDFTNILTITHKILDLINTIKIEPIQSSLSPPPLQLIQKPMAVESIDYREFKQHYAILIVDDSKDNCLFLERYLIRIGYKNISMAYNGPTALQMIENNKFNLVLLDIDMPIMNGLDVLRNLKEIINTKHLLVLIISASDTMENIIEGIHLGAEDFLTKPFNPDLLQVRIGSCLQKHWFITKENMYHEKLEFQRKRYKKLLNAIFPPIIIKELTKSGNVQARNYKNVAIVFADVVGFTTYCDTHQPKKVILNIQALAAICEDLAIKHHIQKIKTIGDAFLGVSGMWNTDANPVLNCISFAKELLTQSAALESEWQLRVGIHFGDVIGGVVGHRQFLFDIWGDAVNTAARIQGVAVVNSIYLSKAAWEKIKYSCDCKPLGKIQLRGKDPIDLFEVL